MKLNNLIYGLLALMVAVISTNAQERGRGDRERRGSDASWAREAMERYRGSGRVNPLDPEAVKRRLDYAVKEGVMTREQADKLQAAAKKRMEVAQRENNDRRGRESQANDRQDQVRKDYEARRKRIEAGVKSGKIKREDAAKMYEGLRKWMEGASRGGDKNKQSNDNNRKGTGDIVDVAAGNKSFRTLVAAVKAAGLVDTLKGKGPYTVFAPTDEAFSKLPKGTVEGLLKPENKKKLVSILTYHVVPGKVLAKDVRSGRVKTANGSSLDVQVTRGGVNVNKAKVVATDVMASNGVIHVIDTVIIPQSSSSRRSSQTKSSQSRGSSRGYLGVAVESSSKPRGLRVQQVYANTAAARAKIQKGDIILKMNGATVSSNSSLIGRLSKAKPGQKATLLVSSGGKTKTVQVQLGGAYSTRSLDQSSSKKSNSSQSKKPQTKGKDHDHDKGDRDKKDHGQDRVQHLKQAIDHLRAAGRHDLAEEVEKRVHEAHRNQDQHRHEHKGHADHGDRGRRDRGEEMRKAWEERMKQWREAQEKANNAKRPSQSRGSSGTDWRKAIEERMKKAREDRERAERNSRGRGNDRGEALRKAIGEWMERARETRERVERDSRGRGNDRGRNDRGEDMRKVWEERMKQWREARERDGDRDGRRPETQRGSQGRGPGAQHGPERGRGPQGRGPGAQRGPERGHGPQGRGSQNQRGPQKGRGPQSGGPGRSGPQRR